MALATENTQYDRLEVQVFADRQGLGEQAGDDVAHCLRQRLKAQQRVRIVFASAPSQNEFLARLRQAPGIDWSRITVFHMDEYIGLNAEAEQRFSYFLQQQLLRHVQPGEVHLIPSQGDPAAICADYSALFSAAPIDVVCLGIGENGHLAFNDPPVADFHDPRVMKPVELDLACRQQQVNDGCFQTLGEVPTHALTLTIPALLSARRLFCMVPGSSKRQAVARTLTAPIATDCPATILRTHERCTLYTDKEAYREVNGA